LIVQRPFQSINGICFYIDWKKLTLELLFEVGPGLNEKNTGVCLLVKEVLGPSHSLFILKKDKGLEDFFLIAAKLLWGQVQI